MVNLFLALVNLLIVRKGHLYYKLAGQSSQRTYSANSYGISLPSIGLVVRPVQSDCFRGQENLYCPRQMRHIP